MCGRVVIAEMRTSVVKQDHDLGWFKLCNVVQTEITAAKGFHHCVQRAHIRKENSYKYIYLASDSFNTYTVYLAAVQTNVCNPVNMTHVQDDQCQHHYHNLYHSFNCNECKGSNSVTEVHRLIHESQCH